MERKDTNHKDRNGRMIYTGDIVYCKYGYYLLVCEYRNNPGQFYGSLICEVEDSCREAHYSIDNSERAFISVMSCSIIVKE